MAARSYPTWIITQQPNEVPFRKGPFHDNKLVEAFLREAYRLYPEIICIVVDGQLDNTWWPQHGYEWLDINGDGRKRHPRKDRPSSPSPQPIVAPSDDLRDRVMRAICDPATEGFRGERSTIEWQTDAVMRVLQSAEPAPSQHLRGKPTIAVGTYTITELYAGRSVESDFVIMVPADDLAILMDGAGHPLAGPLKITDSVILAACRAHTPQFDRLDAEIARYAKEQMRDALTAALKIMEISR